MSEMEKESSISAADLDRLVDSELPGVERQRLIEQLDAEPDGWRRCTLAFLEAQQWRQSFGGIIGDSERSIVRHGVEEKVARRVAPHPAVTGDLRSPDAPRLCRAWIAVAATVAAAFGTGLGAGALLWPQQPPADVLVRDVNSPAKRDAQQEPSPDQTEGAVAEAAAAEFLVEGFAQLGGKGESAVTVPITSGPGLDEQWIRSLPAPLSEEEQRRLEREGWQVEQERQFVSVLLAGDRRVMIPVDSVQYRYVGPKVY